MKKTLLSMALVIAAQAGFAADGNIHIKGNLKGVGDTLIVLENTRGSLRDTVLVKNGQFDLYKAIDKVTTLYCVEPGAFRGERGAQVSFIAVPDETIELTGEVGNRYDITGSKFYREFHEADLVMEPIQTEQNALMAKAQKMMQEVGRDSAVAYYNANAPQLEAKMEKTIIDFIKAHPDYEASAAIIPNLKPEKMSEAAALLSDGVKNGRLQPYYQGIIDRHEAQKKAEEEAAKKQAAGVEAPDFTLNDINGKPLTLSSLRGKHVVLDFWGSWCGWCIKGIPDMKKYYEKYNGKFEILGVDCNDTDEKWKDAVKKYELPWLHVYNPRDSKVLSDYGVQGFPTKIIIGPDGKIVKTIVGEDPAFYTLLDELFGK